MANADTPFGLRPIRHRTGAPYNGACNPCYVNATYGTALFIGDPVIKVAGGSNAASVSVPGGGTFAIGTLPEIEKATAGDTNRITGVIVGFSPLPTNLEQKHNPASTQRVAYVCDDPDVIFEIQADGAIPAASVGLNAVVIYTHSGSTATGLSGVELDTTSDVPAADASNQLLIVRAVNREDNDTTLTHAKVEVLINQHTESQGTVGTLGI
jgi:hypothetical protein